MAGPVTRADVLLVVIPQKGGGIACSVVTAKAVLPVCASLLIVSVSQLEIVEDAPQVLPRVGEPLVLADGDRRVLELGHGQVELLNLNAYVKIATLPSRYEVWRTVAYLWDSRSSVVLEK